MGECKGRGGVRGRRRHATEKRGGGGTSAGGSGRGPPVRREGLGHSGAVGSSYYAPTAAADDVGSGAQRAANAPTGEGAGGAGGGRPRRRAGATSGAAAGEGQRRVGKGFAEARLRQRGVCAGALEGGSPASALGHPTAQVQNSPCTRRCASGLVLVDRRWCETVDLDQLVCNCSWPISVQCRAGRKALRAVTA